MHPLITAALGFVGAIIFAATSVWFEPTTTATTSTMAAIFARLPELVPPFVGIYAASVLLVTTATLVVDIRRARARLKKMTSPNRGLWTGAFSGTELSGLTWRLIRSAPARSTAPSERIVVEMPFEPRSARQEIVRLYQDLLSRAQFFTAVAILLGLAFFGFSETYGLIKPVGTPIATVPIAAAIFGLLALAIYFRSVVESAAEPLIATIADVSFERQDMLLLQSIANATQRNYGHSIGDASTPSAYPEAENLVRSLLRTRRSFEKGVSQLSKNVEVVAAACRQLADQYEKQQDNGSNIKGLSELQLAVEALTTAMKNLHIVEQPIAMAPQSVLVEPVSSSATSDTNLSGEIRRLLHELE